MSGSWKLLCLEEPRGGFGVRCHCPGHWWELQLQRAAQASEINPKQQGFHASREHEPGVVFPSIALLCPCLPCPPTGLFVGLCPWGWGDPTKPVEPGAAVVSSSSAQLGRCGHCHPALAAHTARCSPCGACCLCCVRCPRYLLPTLPARCQSAKVSDKSCPYSQKPVTDLFSPPTRHTMLSTGDNATSLPSGSWRAAI